MTKINEDLQKLQYDVYDNNECLLSAQQVSVLAGRMSAAFEGYNHENENLEEKILAKINELIAGK